MPFSIVDQLLYAAGDLMTVKLTENLYIHVYITKSSMSYRCLYILLQKAKIIEGANCRYVFVKNV